MITTLSAQEERLIHALQLLGDKTRFRIFKLLASGHDMCVSEIAEDLGISVSAVSQHFRNFEMLGLVSKERMGQRICYELKSDDAFVQELAKLTKEG
ncbi:winged helix-turn-helix transcriptional regulator [Candidatus Saccharibacteria bacterium]|nr:winged helix-turn-helix transcriptional regulator [Candidatus Saccharibacteria bacterium]